MPSQDAKKTTQTFSAGKLEQLTRSVENMNKEATRTISKTDTLIKASKKLRGALSIVPIVTGAMLNTKWSKRKTAQHTSEIATPKKHKKYMGGWGKDS